MPLSVEDHVAELVRQGLPPLDAQAFADVIEPLREGTDEYVSDGVQRALGRLPAPSFVLRRDAEPGSSCFAGSMSGKDEARARLQQMRDKAQELQTTAERTKDPAERKRLQEKARRLKSQSDEESMERGGDIYPSK